MMYLNSFAKHGAGEAIRTPDPNLGKVALSGQNSANQPKSELADGEQPRNGPRTGENVSASLRKAIGRGDGL